MRKQAPNKLKQMLNDYDNQGNGRNADGTFKKGTSGNPAGRPRRSDLEKAMLSQIYQLAPAAIESLEMLLSPENDVPANVRIRAVEIVINRVCGTALNADALEEYEDKLRWDGGSISGEQLVESVYDLMK